MSAKSKLKSKTKSSPKSKPATILQKIVAFGGGFVGFFKGVWQVNLANKLTILRILMLPPFVVFMMNDSIPHNLLWALIVFVIASITDWLDGYIARTRMLVTPLGQFLDPIADKILVMAAMLCMVELGWFNGWSVIAILARDFVVGAVRLIAVESEEKLVIPARASGKVKTMITMVSLGALLLLWVFAGYGVIGFEIEEHNIFTNVTQIYSNPARLLVPIGNAFMYICVALTAFSGIQYIWDARDVLKKQFTEN
ncbi:MAG: CDP-diacylglycerol--glycerol-3-phosphate 3-phosphatidyltransferase [Oscillospiraceae bacterium]|nr:CDP-diacylglycerol--glycerol-3-phosphate 3-phosphatidyltransferase [Oscillospiraceae bacterium]